MVMKHIIAVMLLCWVFCSCEKEGSFEDCKGGVLIDSLSISTKLPGAWKWVESMCGFCPPGQQPIKSNKIVIATFKTDNTYSVTEESKIIEEGHWQVLDNNFGYYISLDNNGFGYLQCPPRICNRKLASDCRANDGSANFFVRID